MLVIIATSQIKPEFREPFLAAIEEDATGSMQNEPGCLQFSIVQDEKDPNRIYLFEVYRDQAAFDTHRRMPHYLEWRETVKDWYAAPTQVIRGANIYPPDAAWTK